MHQFLLVFESHTNVKQVLLLFLSICIILLKGLPQPLQTKVWLYTLPNLHLLPQGFPAPLLWYSPKLKSEYQGEKTMSWRPDIESDICLTSNIGVVWLVKHHSLLSRLHCNQTPPVWSDMGCEYKPQNWLATTTNQLLWGRTPVKITCWVYWSYLILLGKN